MSKNQGQESKKGSFRRYEVGDKMPKAEQTKLLLAQTLKKLMKKTPLDKISVQDLVDACELNRKTFYYHFKDKQELICWIFDTEFAALHDTNNDNSIIDELVEHLYINKDFYIAALTSNTQNNLQEHLYHVGYKAILFQIKDILGSRQMAIEDMDMIALFFTNAVIGYLSQWAKEGMKKSPYEYISDYYHLIQDTLHFIINKRVKPSL